MLSSPRTSRPKRCPSRVSRAALQRHQKLSIASSETARCSGAENSIQLKDHLKHGRLRQSRICLSKRLDGNRRAHGRRSANLAERHPARTAAAIRRCASLGRKRMHVPHARTISLHQFYVTCISPYCRSRAPSLNPSRREAMVASRLAREWPTPHV